MKRKGQNPSIFNYLNYRSYLCDWYRQAKENRRGFSFRAFSKVAGFTSPNFLKLVMEGQRNLTEESLGKFSKALGLNKQEHEFFKNLVFFNQAQTHSQKDFYYQKLIQSRKFSELKPLEKNQYDFYSTWYHPVVRELITHKDFDGTPLWLSLNTTPAITETQAKKSLELLKSLGLIEETQSGQWAQKDSIISTGPESKSLTLLNYHQNLLELAKKSLQDTPPHHRDVSALTLGITQDKLPLLKQKIQDFRQEILKLVSTDTKPDSVHMLSLQLFPVTPLEKVTHE